MKNKPAEKIISGIVLTALILVAAFLVVRRGAALLPEEPAISEAPVSAGPLTVPAESAAPVIPAELRISELMPANKSTHPSADGTFSDWVELVNTGDKDADLSAFTLSADGSGIDLGAEVLAPGAITVISCPGKLKAEGGTLILTNELGDRADTFVYENCEDDMSVYRDGEETVYTDFPSPGYANGDDGYEAYQSTLAAAGPLVINEVMVYNESTLRYAPYTFYDWVEIKNVSNETVNLSDFCLSDSNSDRRQYTLPDKTLAPGAMFIVHCTGDAATAEKAAELAPFALGADRDKLYLTRTDGALIDYVPLRKIPLGGSYGRLPGQNGFFYFTTPTPNAENKNGWRCITPTPVSLEADGVFNDVESVTVSLAGRGNIYYTIGGAVPTASSTPYTGPFTVDKTCVVRAAIVEDGKLTGEPLALSYIINENHTMPVVSLVTAPSDWTMVYDSPARDFERKCSVEYFDGETGESFSIDCGFKLHGATSKKAQAKKSLKLCFRSRYEGNLDFNLFDNGITDYSSIIMRAAQEDVFSTLMRDNLMHELSLETFPDLIAQDYKFAVFYVNGQYWGLYTIREAHSATHCANHRGVDPDTITMQRELITGDCPQLNSIFDFVTKHDMSVAANYEQVCTMLDVDSLIAWSIMESYSGNYDIHPSNVRFYYSSETGLLSYALADLDLAMFDQYTYYNTFELGYKYNVIARVMLNNGAYREKFLQALSAALTGPLSNESVLASIDAMAAEISPEITRDRQRWGSDYAYWEKMVNDLRDYINYGSGRAKIVAAGIRSYMPLSDATYNQYLGMVQ